MCDFRTVEQITELVESIVKENPPKFMGWIEPTEMKHVSVDGIYGIIASGAHYRVYTDNKWHHIYGNKLVTEVD